MKQLLLVCTLLCLLMMSCKTKNSPGQDILTGKNLTSSFISLDADTAYTLKTTKGAIIKIERNSFGTKGKVVLEIKEAYSMQDILLAGLSTESNGKLLSSGGMIYINATAGNEAVELLKPIQISIPGKIYQDGMQLFKGEIKADSTINWINPQSLDKSSVTENLLMGEKLFKANCASCHKPTKDFTAPALAFVRQRTPDTDWPYRFTVNPSAMYQTDAYANALFKKFNGTMMTAFPNLDRRQVNAILDYCDNEAWKEGWPENITGPVNTASADTIKPCFVNDTTFLYAPAEGITIIDNNNQPAKKTSPVTLSKAEENEGLRGGFTDLPVSGMYEFSIETFGWYNIDMYVEGYAGSTYVKVNAQLQMDYKMDMNLYLFCPGKKMLSVSNQFKDGIYSFDKVDGRIPLFLQDEAVLLAFGSKDDNLFYGAVSFAVQKEQTAIIKIKETTKAELQSFIRLNKIDGIKIDAKKREMSYQPDPETKVPVPVEVEIKQVACDELVDSVRKNK